MICRETKYITFKFHRKSWRERKLEIICYKPKMKKSRYYRDNLKLSRFFQPNDNIGDNLNDNLKLSLARYYRDNYEKIAIISVKIVGPSNSNLISSKIDFFFCHFCSPLISLTHPVGSSW